MKAKWSLELKKGLIWFLGWLAVSSLLNRGDLLKIVLEGGITAIFFVSLGILLDWKRRTRSNRNQS